MTDVGPHLSSEALDEIIRRADPRRSGEDPALDQAVLCHLESCDECRRAATALSNFTTLLREAPAEALVGYGSAVRGRMERRLELSPPPPHRPYLYLAAAALTAAILTASVVSLLWLRSPSPRASGPRVVETEPSRSTSKALPDALLAGVETHLERTRRLCIELSNRPAGDDAGDDRDAAWIGARARELLVANRRYRRLTATTAPSLTPTLDRLEPVLAEASRHPTQLVPDAAVRDLLFETRLVQAELAAFAIRPGDREPQG